MVSFLLGSEPEDFGFDNRYISRSRCDVQGIIYQIIFIINDARL